MNTPLLLLRLRRRRDALLARRQARQVAALLRFDPTEQACVAALVYELACQGLAQAGSLRLRFTVEGDRLVIAPEGASPPLRVEKPLPPRDPALAAEDLAWVARRLAEWSPPDLFEEVQKQNQELLRALLELRACQARLAELTRERSGPNAA